MKKRITACLLCLLFLPALTLFAAAKSGRLDAAVATETRAIAVEIESEGAVLLKNEDGTHNDSYGRNDVWGSYDVFGEKGGTAELQFYPEQICAYGAAAG